MKLKFHIGNVAVFLKFGYGAGWGWGSGSGYGYGDIWGDGSSSIGYKVKDRTLVGE